MAGRMLSRCCSIPKGIERKQQTNCHARYCNVASQKELKVNCFVPKMFAPQLFRSIPKGIERWRISGLPCGDDLLCSIPKGIESPRVLVGHHFLACLVASQKELKVLFDTPSFSKPARCSIPKGIERSLKFQNAEAFTTSCSIPKGIERENLALQASQNQRPVASQKELKAQKSP